jgi:hypothetical protein
MTEHNLGRSYRILCKGGYWVRKRLLTNRIFYQILG